MEAPEAEVSTGTKDSEVFKTPILPAVADAAEVQAKKIQPLETVTVPPVDKSSCSAQPSATNCPYKEPSWSEIPKSGPEYWFNILKSGMDIGSKTGWYLYDLGSTHGSWWNKHQIPPKQYIRLHVGHVLKFGGSSRLFILQGPTEDEEAESSKTVTELKLAADRKKLIAEGILEDPDGADKASSSLPEEEHSAKPGVGSDTPSGISWGMVDEYDTNDKDVDEEEGEDIDFESLQQREEYYRGDPKRVLRNWFERNGFELNYEFSEKGTTFKHHWVCTIDLPLDTPSGKQIAAEVTVSGTKREAQVQCALEACRILDANGVLRNQSESKRRKLKTLAENDYYDSDEDTFLDRTGELERKRAARKGSYHP